MLEHFGRFHRAFRRGVDLLWLRSLNVFFYTTITYPAFRQRRSSRIDHLHALHSLRTNMDLPRNAVLGVLLILGQKRVVWWHSIKAKPR